MFKLFLKFCGSIYEFYRVKDPDVAVPFALLLSSIVLFFNLMIVLDFLNYFNLLANSLPKKTLFLILFGIVLLNYLFVFRTERQKGHEITNRFKAGVLVYFIMTAVLTAFGAYLNRNEIN
jgi:hypothetical protein